LPLSTSFIMLAQSGRFLGLDFSDSNFCICVSFRGGRSLRIVLPGGGGGGRGGGGGGTFARDELFDRVGAPWCTKNGLRQCEKLLLYVIVKRSAMRLLSNCKAEWRSQLFHLSQCQNFVGTMSDTSHLLLADIFFTFVQFVHRINLSRDSYPKRKCRTDSRRDLTLFTRDKKREKRRGMPYPWCSRSSRVV
jgi:hypothetical protein